MARSYDVVIVGSGPAGIFTALELTQCSNLSILLLEKGKDLNKRYCPGVHNYTGCLSCSPCAMVSGWGGAGAFSDGKLTLSPEVGGHLSDYGGSQKAIELINYADQRYREFGASADIYGAGDETETLKRKAEAAGMNLIPVPVRHLGTEHCYEVLQHMYEFLSDRVEIHTGVEVDSIVTEDGKVNGIKTHDGQNIQARYLIVAPGR
ncbi:MAG: FAD-dependent oxidoreductase, partial [Chloroflexota bacterium]|nr:FAD-dependent oxidoreductase [Chloroflexota bacterium]